MSYDLSQSIVTKAVLQWHETRQVVNGTKLKKPTSIQVTSVTQHLMKMQKALTGEKKATPRKEYGKIGCTH